jgi:hypothetical protein
MHWILMGEMGNEEIKFFMIGNWVRIWDSGKTSGDHIWYRANKSVPRCRWQGRKEDVRSKLEVQKGKIHFAETGFHEVMWELPTVYRERKSQYLSLHADLFLHAPSRLFF